MLSLCMISNDQPVCLEMITLDHQCGASISHRVTSTLVLLSYLSNHNIDQPLSAASTGLDQHCSNLITSDRPDGQKSEILQASMQRCVLLPHEPVTLLAVMLIKVGDNDKIIDEYCLSARTATDVRCSLTISLIQQLRLDQSSKNNDEIQATQAG
eukprot:g54373.t1